MKLLKPIVCFDIESTGLSFTSDRIVEISYQKINTDLTVGEVKTFLVNPYMPIPPEVTAIHGIADIDVVNAPKFSEIVDGLEVDFFGCDFGGYNIAGFDMMILAEEFARAGKVLQGGNLIDGHAILKAMEPRDLGVVYKKYTGKTLEKAHRSASDVSASTELILKQFEVHSLESVEDITKACGFVDACDVGGKFIMSSDAKIIEHFSKPQAVITFGKHKGKTLRWLAKNEPGFLKWMLGQEFGRDAKQIAINALEGVFP